MPLAAASFRRPGSIFCALSMTPIPASFPSPELALLLECARPRLDEAAAERIRALAAGPLDWELLHALAVEHGVFPLLSLHLRDVAGNILPSDSLAKMSELSRSHSILCLSFVAELFHILEIFRAAGLPAVPYKGPVLAAQAYGDPAHRVFSDLDLILRHSDVARAAGLLAAQGYQSQIPLAAVSAGRVPGQFPFVRPGSRVHVELHTERTLRYFPRRLHLEQMMLRLQSISVNGREVLTFSAEDTLSLLCVHGSKHFWERLMWIADIAALLRRPQGFNWQLCLAQAGLLGAQRMVHLGIWLAQNLLQASLPDTIRSQVHADRGARALASHVQRRYLARDRTTRGIFERMQFRVRMRGAIVPGTAYLLRLATAPTEEDWADAPPRPPLSFLQSVLRPLRLVRKYGLGRKRADGLD
jgi:hypothetical protein